MPEPSADRISRRHPYSHAGDSTPFGDRRTYSQSRQEPSAGDTHHAVGKFRRYAAHHARRSFGRMVCRQHEKYLAATFGKENIVSADLHLDETSPHVHATLVPIIMTERKRKKQEERAVKRYRTKSASRPRLCADDVMSRVKLKRIPKHLCRSDGEIRPATRYRRLESRHVDTQQFYRRGEQQFDRYG